MNVITQDQIVYIITDENDIVTITQHQEVARYLEDIWPGTNITIDKTDPKNPIISSSGGGGGNTNFLGVYVSLVALQTAYPTATAGDYAYVDAGVGTDITSYIWDDTDAAWVAGGGTPIVPDASEIVKGIAELATQAETNAGTDDLKIVTPKKLKDQNYLAPLDSPAFVGTPTAPTPSPSDNSTKVATTAYVDAAVSGGTNAGSKIYMFNNFT